MLSIRKSEKLPFSVDDRYKIYNDGGHYVATRVFQSCVSNSYKQKPKCREDIDILFDSLYMQAQKDGLKDGKIDKSLTDFIRNGILRLFPDFPDLNSFIANKIKRKRHNLAVRKKRARRKAYMGKWNYLVTFTYDDKKHTVQTFRRKLKKCLFNLAVRRRWRCMGYFETGKETDRLHFHCLMYIPTGEMVGTITERKDYSTEHGKMQITHVNSFFEKTFGRNDFMELSDGELRHGNALEYILKYIGKSNERLVCIGKVPTEIYKRLTVNDIVTEFTDYVTKYVLFDDIVDFGRDVLRQTKYKQMTIVDLICNPPLVA